MKTPPGRNTPSKDENMLIKKTYSPWKIPSYSFKKVLLDSQNVQVTPPVPPKASSKPPQDRDEDAVHCEEYSILNPAHVFHDAATLLKLSALDSSQNPAHFTCYQPARIALHETIVLATTQIQYETEEDLKKIIKHVMGLLTPELDKITIEHIRLRDSLLEKTKVILREYPKPVSDVLQHHKLIFTELSLHYQEYDASAVLKSAFKDKREYLHYLAIHITDILYTKLAMTHIRQDVASVIDGLIDEQVYEAMPVPEQDKRITFTVSGGTGSGKTTSVALMMKTASEVYGIPWRQIAKLDTNIYQSLLIEPGSVDIALFSQFSAPEASYVHRLVQKAFHDKVLVGCAPHMFIDQVFVNHDKLDLSTFYSGRVEGMVVSTDVKSAVERAYQRGVETGRYEPTQTILRTHRGVAVEFPQVLKGYRSRSVTYRIMDNNVPKGTQPIEIAVINLKTNQIHIKSCERMLHFIAKREINPAAESVETLYHKEPKDEALSSPIALRRRINQYFAPLLKCKIIIEDEAPAETEDLDPKKVERHRASF